MDFPDFTEGDWVFVHSQNTIGKIIEKSCLWGNTVFRVWLPSTDSIIRVPRSSLSPTQSSTLSTHHLIYLAAAARVADALTQDVLLAPIESSVIPLPHQIRALSRAISSDRVRYLLADEVGLGKTVEAGLIMRELKLRGLVRRTLVIAPKGLVTQWVAEMRTHFNEDFRLLIPGDSSSSLYADHDNIWQSYHQIVCPMDSVKPLIKRRGWTKKQIADYNRKRFEDLISAGWDLIIVDEAHRLGGSTDQVARYKLGQGLAEAAPYLLLLSATPHQGKTDAFHRLISLLDPDAFPDISSVTRDRVQPYIIRTEKRQAIDAEGRPLFKPRRTELAPVSWEERHQEQRLLYEAVTEYVRKGYNQAMQEKRSYIGFLMILMQRLVVSSTRAIRTTLERRLEVLKSRPQVLDLFVEAEILSEEPEIFYDLDGETQREILLHEKLNALKNEQEEVKFLLDAAIRCELKGPDAKAEALLDWIYRLQAEEGDPDLKVLVFTEFVPTQEMLFEFLSERGFKVVCLNGSMNMDLRKKVQDDFARNAQILISTDAGGEGLNLQFCHVVINYDIPWNPMRLEQRIGRVDRIGQSHTVRAINFVFEDSVEHRVREVLEQKLEVIFNDFGIDKTSDVLDSAQAGKLFDDLYIEAILNPETVEKSVEQVVKNIQQQAQEVRESVAVFGSAEDLNPHDAQRLMSHPLPHWVEKMTVSYLQASGGQAEKKRGKWMFAWPDGETMTDVVFSAKSAEKNPAVCQMTLENPEIRGLTMRLPCFAPGQPVPVITLPDLSPEIQGFWSLWQISIQNDSLLSAESSLLTRKRRMLPLFLSDNGRVYMPTARYIWDQLLTSEPIIVRHLDSETSHQAFLQLKKVALVYGKDIYEELKQAYQKHIAKEREKGERAFAARRKIIERIGLPQVRNYRLNLLAQEEREFQNQIELKMEVMPEMLPLLLVRVIGETENGEWKKQGERKKDGGNNGNLQ